MYFLHHQDNSLYCFEAPLFKFGALLIQNSPGGISHLALGFLFDNLTSGSSTTYPCRVSLSNLLKMYVCICTFMYDGICTCPCIHAWRTEEDLGYSLDIKSLTENGAKFEAGSLGIAFTSTPSSTGITGASSHDACCDLNDTCPLLGYAFNT